MPEMVRRMVDLPQPEGPRMQRVEGRSTPKVMSTSTRLAWPSSPVKSWLMCSTASSRSPLAAAGGVRADGRGLADMVDQGSQLNQRRLMRPRTKSVALPMSRMSRMPA